MIDKGGNVMPKKPTNPSVVLAGYQTERVILKRKLASNSLSSTKRKRCEARLKELDDLVPAVEAAISQRKVRLSTGSGPKLTAPTFAPTHGIFGSE